jgi:hypothetical protein
VIQPTENPAQPFSYLVQFQNQQPPCIASHPIISCYQAATNDQTHELVMKYQDTLPIYDGLDGARNGPRYCPSIHKKVHRFPERNSHNCFLAVTPNQHRPVVLQHPFRFVQNPLWLRAPHVFTSWSHCLCQPSMPSSFISHHLLGLVLLIRADQSNTTRRNNVSVT